MDSIFVYLVDDDAEMRNSLKHYLGKAGCRVEEFAGAESALAALEHTQPEVIITDLRMPGLSGIALLKAVRTSYPTLPVVIISAHGDIPMTVEAMKSGAYNFVEKPFEPNRLLTIIKNAAGSYRLLGDNNRLRARLTELSGLDRVLLGESDPIRRIKSEIVEIADTDASVLIVGETGTGKEVIARALHDLSARSAGPFVALNCAAIAENLFESAMFGHSVGAFTGADRPQSGYFQEAHNGTLFLDEVRSCSPEHQSKLLRAIECKEVTPVGKTKPEKVNLRIVSATNENLESAISEGQFRSDLFFRLNTIELVIPPLRERVDDIPILYTHFLKLHAESYAIPAPVIAPSDLSTLVAHDWPGNVRELNHIAERHLLFARRGKGTLQDAMKSSGGTPGQNNTLKDAMNAHEKLLIENTLRTSQGRMDAAAAALGIGRRTLNEKLVKLGIDRTAFLT